jgi:hypothetical protein
MVVLAEIRMVLPLTSDVLPRPQTFPGKEREKINLYEYHMSIAQMQEEIAAPDEAREPPFSIIGLAI